MQAHIWGFIAGRACLFAGNKVFDALFALGERTAACVRRQAVVFIKRLGGGEQ